MVGNGNANGNAGPSVDNKSSAQLPTKQLQPRRQPKNSLPLQPPNPVSDLASGARSGYSRRYAKDTLGDVEVNARLATNNKSSGPDIPKNQRQAQPPRQPGNGVPSSSPNPDGDLAGEARSGLSGEQIGAGNDDVDGSARLGSKSKSAPVTAPANEPQQPPLLSEDGALSSFTNRTSELTRGAGEEWVTQQISQKIETGNSDAGDNTGAGAISQLLGADLSTRRPPLQLKNSVSSSSLELASGLAGEARPELSKEEVRTGNGDVESSVHLSSNSKSVLVTSSANGSQPPPLHPEDGALSSSTNQTSELTRRAATGPDGEWSTVRVWRKKETGNGDAGNNAGADANSQSLGTDLLTGQLRMVFPCYPLI